MHSDTINVTAVFCFGAVAHTEWVSGSWIEMMHLPPAILSQAPPKRLQIAQMGDIWACYRIATYFLLLLWQKLLMQSFKKQEGEMQSEQTHFTRCCLLGWWMERRGWRMERRGWRMVSVQGALVHSTACQTWYLSASNRGTGEDRQHLLSKLNYLPSTKQEEEAMPQPGLCHTCTDTCTF